MFSSSAAEEIRQTIKQYPDSGSALLPVLHIAQRELGWLPSEAMQSVAETLDLPKSHVWGVATFHSMLMDKPAARNIIQLCTNVSCMLFGAETLLEIIENKYSIKQGGITADGRFSLIIMECIGLCDHAPAMLVNKDVHRCLDAGSIIDILERYE